MAPKSGRLLISKKSLSTQILMLSPPFCYFSFSVFSSLRATSKFMFNMFILFGYFCVNKTSPKQQSLKIREQKQYLTL